MRPQARTPGPPRRTQQVINSAVTSTRPPSPARSSRFEGHGIISGLGITTLTGSEVADPSTGAISGSGTFVAANGDELTFAWADLPVSGAPPVITFTGPMTVTGASWSSGCASPTPGGQLSDLPPWHVVNVITAGRLLTAAPGG